jgi:hypothetical protein
MANGLWATVRGWFEQNAQAHVLASLEQGDPLKPYQSYLRVWLAEMFLAKRQTWLQQWFPAVHAEVRLPFAGQPEVSFARVVRPQDDQLGEGVLINYPLTELLPYSGGVVEVEAALLGLKGQDSLAAGVGLLERFSGLIAPPLGQALTLAAQLTVGARDFLDRAGGGVHLALHQGFSAPGGGGGNVLRPGYAAVILATPAQVPVGELRVEGDRLHLGGAPFTAHDFMLLRIEARDERDDWRSPAIEDARRGALDALQRGDSEGAQRFLGAAIAAVFTSYDFSEADKRRVVAALKQEWKELEGLGLGAAAQAPPARLDELVAAYPMPHATAAALGPLTAEEAFAGI